MKDYSFSSVSYGKWILAGEHSVLRGAPALVFPVFNYKFELHYEDSNDEVSFEFKGQQAEEFRLLFSGVLDQALQRTNQKRSELKGHFIVNSQLPLGAGLGASAALCVGIARWIHFKDWIEESEIYEFARSLENIFHGESSGVDIAVSLSGQGLKFYRGGDRQILDVKWSPRLYLSYCGHRGVTSECVSQVKKFIELEPDQAKQCDQLMEEAVRLSEEALLNSGGDEGFDKLSESIQKARLCFDSWKLTDGPLGDHLEWLEENGAKAVKPTGSGGGGYALSLWEMDPPESVKSELIELRLS